MDDGALARIVSHDTQEHIEGTKLSFYIKHPDGRPRNDGLYIYEDVPGQWARNHPGFYEKMRRAGEANHLAKQKKKKSLSDRLAKLSHLGALWDKSVHA